MDESTDTVIAMLSPNHMAAQPPLATNTLRRSCRKASKPPAFLSFDPRAAAKKRSSTHAARGKKRSIHAASPSTSSPTTSAHPTALEDVSSPFTRSASPLEVIPTLSLPPLTQPNPLDQTVLALGLPKKTATSPGLSLTREDLVRFREGGYKRAEARTDRDRARDARMTTVEVAWRRWEETTYLPKGMGAMGACGYDKRGKAYKPTLSLVSMIRLVIAASPMKKLALSQIYQAISERWPSFVLGEKTWQNSVRHNLSLQDCFVLEERPLHEGGTGKGSYWRVKETPGGMIPPKPKRSSRHEVLYVRPDNRSRSRSCSDKPSTPGPNSVKRTRQRSPLNHSSLESLYPIPVSVVDQYYQRSPPPHTYPPDLSTGLHTPVSAGPVSYLLEKPVDWMPREVGRFLGSRAKMAKNEPYTPIDGRVAFTQSRQHEITTPATVLQDHTWPPTPGLTPGLPPCNHPPISHDPQRSSGGMTAPSTSLPHRSPFSNSSTPPITGGVVLPPISTLLEQGEKIRRHRDYRREHGWGARARGMQGEGLRLAPVERGELC